MCDANITQTYGADPARIQWKVVRGDTASLRVDFLNLDETTYWDNTTWTYSATSYDPKGDILDELTVEAFTGYVVITAPASLTGYWGTKYTPIVAELSFDLQVTIPNTQSDLVWTPVIGTICVLGDITPGGSL